LLLHETNAIIWNCAISIVSVDAISTADATSGSKGGLNAPRDGPFSYGPSRGTMIDLS
jgi:hypothetical protein